MLRKKLKDYRMEKKKQIKMAYYKNQLNTKRNSDGRIEGQKANKKHTKELNGRSPSLIRIALSHCPSLLRMILLVRNA